MEIIRNGTFKGTLLLEELIAAYPQLMEMGADGEYRQQVKLGTTSTQAKIVIPDELGISEAGIQTILDAHDPNQLASGEVVQAQQTASFAELTQAKVTQALASIDDDRALLPAATAAEVKEIVDRLLLRQKKMIQALQYLAE
jgi:hypothetical protein